MKKYTHNWNQEFIKNTFNFKKIFNFCLEIGSYEGLTSNYIVDNILTNEGKLICIDPLTDNYLNDNLTDKDIDMNINSGDFFNGQYDRFVNNVKEHLESDKIELIRDLSINVFEDLIKKYKGKFDFIYIDGDHRPEGVYIDAINSFKLCKSGGYILFDDYKWVNTGEGIDRFLNENDGYDIILKGEQVLILKK